MSDTQKLTGHKWMPRRRDWNSGETIETDLEEIQLMELTETDF